MDTLVSTVCECVLLCSNLAVDRSALLTTMESSLAGYYWLPPLLDMLSGHPALHPALYVRLWELLHAQVRVSAWLVAEWLKHSTANRKVAGSSPIISLLGVYRRRKSKCVVSPEIVRTASFGGDVKLSVPRYWLV